MAAIGGAFIERRKTDVAEKDKVGAWADGQRALFGLFVPAFVVPDRASRGP